MVKSLISHVDNDNARDILRLTFLTDKKLKKDWAQIKTSYFINQKDQKHRRTERKIPRTIGLWESEKINLKLPESLVAGVPEF